MRKRKWLRFLAFLPLRLLGLLLIFLILLSLTVTVGLRLAFTPERLRTLVVAELQELFHRPVQLESVDIVLFQGVRVSGLRILESPEFPGRQFLSSRLLVAKPRLLPLLRSRMEFSEFKLWSPAIQVIRREDGRWNVADLLGPRPRARLRFLVSEAALKDGRLIIEDRALGRRHEFQSVDLNVSALDVETPCPFRLRTEALLQISTTVLPLSLKAEGEFSLADGDLDRVALELSDSQWHSGALKVRLRGTLQGLRSPVLSLAFEAGEFRSEDVPVPFPPGLSLPAAAGTLQATLPSRRRFVVQAADLRAGPVSLAGRGFLDLSTSTPAWKIDFETGRFDLALASRMWRQAAGWGASGTGQISAAARGGASAGLDRLRLSLQDAHFRWRNLVFAGLDGSLAGTRDLAQASVRIVDGTVRYHSQELEALRAVASLKSGRLEVQSLEAKWNRAPLSLRGVMDPMIGPDRIAVEGSLSSVGLEDAVGTIRTIIEEVRAARGGASRAGWWLQVFKKSLPKGFPALTGDLKIGRLHHPNFTGDKARLTWKLSGISPGLKQLQGQVVADWGPGLIQDVPGLMKLHVAYRVLFLPFTTMDRINQMGILSSEEMRNFDYARIHGDYVFRSGNMSVNNFWVDGREMVATSEGTVDWPQETLYLHIVTRVNHAKRGAAPETLSDEKGRPTLSFYVDGPMLNPEVRLEMSKVPARHFEGFIEQGQKVSEENVRKMARELW